VVNDLPFSAAGAVRPGRTFSILLAYLLVVFLGAALLAPWIWKASHALFPGSAFLRHPFHRYVNRCLIFMAIAGLWPLYRLGFFPDLHGGGWRWRRGLFREVGFGMALGFVTLALVVVAAWGTGIRAWIPGRGVPLVLLHVARAAGAAMSVSILEEFLFRGAILGALRRSVGFWVAAIVSSTLYALVHFFQRPVPPETVDWSTGFQMLRRMSAGFGDTGALFPGFINLTLAGLILAAFRERTGALWTSIGLHAGWIFWLKSYAFFTVSTTTSPSPFWGTSKLIDGWIAFPVLFLAGVGLRYCRRRTLGPTEAR
jgi:membrane protease YdiL (CAAX protease family)